MSWPRSTEAAPLLSQHQRTASPPPRSQDGSNSATSSSSSSSEDEPLPSYSFLILAHALGLLPSVVFLVGFAFAALRSPCQLPLAKNHGGAKVGELSKERCSELLGARSPLSWSLFLLAVASYTAAHKVRNLISRFCSLLFRVVRVFIVGSPSELETRYDVLAKDDDDAATTIFSFVSRALFTEAFKVLVVVLAAALVLGQTFVESLSSSQGHIKVEKTTGSDIIDSIRLSRLDPTDGRFRIAVWLAIGWTTTELLTGTVQLFRQLAMYAPLYVPEALDINHDRQNGLASSFYDESGAHILDPPVLEVEYGSLAERRPPSASHDDESASIYRGDSAVTVSPVVQPHGMLSDPLPQNIQPIEAITPSASAKARGKSPKSTLARARLQIQRLMTSDRSAASSSKPHATPVSASGAVHQQQDYFGTFEDLDGGEELYDEERAAEDGAINRLESQIDRLVAARTRVKLERSLGASLPDLPVVLASLWRLDAALWSVGSLLLISSAVALGQGRELFAPRPLDRVADLRHHRSASTAAPQLFPSLESIAVTFTVLSGLYAIFNSFWKLALASWMITYPSLLVGLGLLLAGLARWDFIV